MRVKDMSRRQQKAVFANLGYSSSSSLSTSDRDKILEREFTRPKLISVGTEKFVLPGQSMKDARTQATFERIIMRTPDYKNLQKRGWPKDAAITKVMKEKNIKTKPGTKWFDLKNLEPLSKAYPDKDFDKDGVKNFKDCKPFDKSQQHLKKKSIFSKIKIKANIALIRFSTNDLNAVKKSAESDIKHMKELRKSALKTKQTVMARDYLGDIQSQEASVKSFKKAIRKNNADLKKERLKLAGL